MKYTKEEVVQFTINILSGISVPVTEAKEIGVPVLNAIGNLKVLQEIIAAENAQRDIPEEEDDGKTDSE